MKRYSHILIASSLLFSFFLGCVPSKADSRETLESKNEELITAFVHVNVVPMTEEVVLNDQSVLVQGDRVTTVGESGEVDIPPDANIIDATGAYLMPGLADMHVHTVEQSRHDWPVSPLNLYLANGVTTIRDNNPTPSQDDETFILKWREEIAAGTLAGPTIYTAGKKFNGPVMEPQGFEGLMRAQAEAGFDFAKLYSDLSPAEYHQAMTAARALGVYTVGHIPVTVGLDGVLAEGMNEIAHIEELDFEFIDFDRDGQLPVEMWMPYIIKSALEQNDVLAGFDPANFKHKHSKRLSAIIDTLKAAEVPLHTTLVVDETIVQKLFALETYLSRPEIAYLPLWYVEMVRLEEDKHQVTFRGIENLATWKYGLDKFLLVELHRAGIPLILGTDAGTDELGVVAGFSMHDELRILVENGFSPFEALLTATVNASQVVEKMTGVGDFGTIEVGNRADLILVKGNPLEDLTNTKNILGVMAAGRWYPVDVLETMITIKE